MKKNRNAERRRRRENRGAEGAEGGGVGCGEGVSPPYRGRGLGRGLCPSPENFLDFRPRNSVFGAFWALYFTIELPALRTESGYIHVGDRYI